MQHAELLRIPGPTPVPPRVQQAMSHPMIDHRSERAEKLLTEIQPKIRKVFGTKQDVLIVTGSGTSGMEAATVNVTSAGDEVIVINTGAFGARFAEICEAYQLKVHRLDVPLGEAVDLDVLEKTLKENPKVKAVIAIYCETSTSVLNPIKEIAEVVRKHSNALLIVDGVSAVAGVETNMDEWGADIVVTSSQKAFMLPPGMMFISISERGWKAIQANKQSRYYLNLQSYQEKLQVPSAPFTPSLSLLFGLEEVLQMFEEEGLKSVYGRHIEMREMLRSAMKAIGVPLLVTDDSIASPTVTALRPETVHVEELRTYIRENFNLYIAGGINELEGKILRVGHMGYCSPSHVLQVISILEMGLYALGEIDRLGDGVSAAQKICLGKREASATKQKV